MGSSRDGREAVNATEAQEKHINKRLAAWAILVMCAQGLVGCGRSDPFSTPVAPSPQSLAPFPAPQRPLVDLTGNYVVTFEADSSCEQLPEVLRTRTYEASIGYIGAERDGTRHYFRANLSGAHFESYARFFIIRVIDKVFFFDFSDSLIVEEPEPGTYLTIIGGAGDATVDPSDLSRISTPFEGHFLYCVTSSELTPPSFGCPADAIAYSACRSKNSRWTLTRR
jgi:hypothetical protein